MEAAEDREQFMEDLYAAGGGAESPARDQLREHLKAQGIEWDGEI